MEHPFRISFLLVNLVLNRPMHQLVLSI